MKPYLYGAILLFIGCGNPQGNISTISSNFHPGISSSIKFAIPVTLTNNQATATGANFQQMVIINSSINSSLYASNLQNVNWEDGSGNILPSWLESGETNASAASAYWINLGANSIPGSGGTFTIYQVIYPTNFNVLDGITTGAEPNYTGTYGQYDSGANVFTQYGGKSWSNFTTIGGTWDTIDGYLEQTASVGAYSDGPCALIETTNYAANASFTIETAFSYTVQAIARVGLAAVMTPSGGDANGYRFVGEQSSNGAGFLSFLNDQKAWIVSNNYLGSVATNYTMQVQNNAGTYSGTLFSGYGVTGVALTTLANTTYTAANNSAATTGFVGVSAAYYSGTVVANPAKFQWFRMRNLPPNEVMPVTTIQSVVNIGTGSP